MPKEARKLVKVTLPRPKTEKPQHFLYDEDNLTLYEVVQYRDEFRSWFVDNQLCSDGHLKIFTKIDPLYIFVPQLINYAKDQYRPLGDICQDFEQFIATSKANKVNDESFLPSSSGADRDKNPTFDRLDYALAPDIKWDSICDTRQIDDDLFVRFSETKTIDWLVNKHAKVMSSLEEELASSASKATLISYAMDLLDDYVHESLSSKFREAVRKKQYDKSNLAISNTISKSSTQTPKATTKRTASSSAQASAAKTQPPAIGIAKFFAKKK